MQTVRRNRILLVVSISLFWFAQYVYIPFQTPYLDSLNAAATLTGIVVGAYGLTQTLLRLPLGIFADRRNRHKGFILAGLICSSLASVIRLLIATPGAFLLANMLSGIASAMWISFTVFFASLFGEGETKRAMGISMAACNGGILIAFIAGSLIGGLDNIRTVFSASIISGAVGLTIALFIHEPKPELRPILAGSTFSVLRSKPLIFWSILGITLQAIVTSTALSFTASYLKQFTEESLLLGVGASIFIVSSVLFSVLTGYVKRLGNHTLVILLFGSLLLYCVLMPLTNAVWQICLLQVAAGAGSGGLMPLLMALALEGVDPRSKSTVMGFFQAVYGVGMTLGPILMGALIQSGDGYIVGYWAMALLALVSMVAVQFNRPRMQA